MNAQEQELKTQADRLAKKLLELKPDITTEDRAAAREQFEFTPETISRYVNGKVNDNDTAVALITFFKNRIAQRDKAVA